MALPTATLVLLALTTAATAQNRNDRFEALLQQKADGRFTDEDRQVLTAAARKILETEQRGHPAGSAC
jgi:hypothetical protein